jgi:hypothetical protein
MPLAARKFMHAACANEVHRRINAPPKTGFTSAFTVLGDYQVTQLHKSLVWR